MKYPSLNKKNVESMAFALVLLPLSTYFLSQMVFAAGYHQTWMVAVTAMTACLLFLFKETGSKGMLLVFSAVVLVCLGISSVMWDYTYDGSGYHADIVNSLAKKEYNPFYQWNLQQDDMLTRQDAHFWANHYAKGMETVHSSWVALTGNLESGKATNLFFILSAFLFIYNVLSDYLTSQKARVVCAFAATFNPVVCSQMFSYYIDWTGYIFLIISMVLLFRLSKPDKEHATKKHEIFFYALLIFSVSVKINVSFWLFFFSIVFMLAMKHAQGVMPPKRLLPLTVASAVVGFMLSFNPYVTNYIQKGNPLYPLAGSDKVDIMTTNTPGAMVADNAFAMVNKSLFLPPLPQYNISDSEHYTTTEFIKKQAVVLASPDIRIGGFGVFFIHATILLLCISLFSRSEKRLKQTIMGGVILLYASLFLLPSGWWARYVAYFYLFPLILMPLCHTARPQFCKFLLRIAIVLLVFDSIVSLTACIGGNILMHRRAQTTIQLLKNADNSNLKVYSVSALFVDKLNANNIHHTLTATEPTTDPITVKVSFAPVCISGTDLNLQDESELFKRKH